MRLHRTAIVPPTAKIGEGVTVGPYSIIGENVSIGDGTSIGSHVIVDGWTEIGRGCRIFSHAVLGTEPQDLKFQGEKSYLFIGDHTVVREFATINRATVGGGGKTVIGNHGLIMAYAHVAHDCILGDHVILANAATLGGHVIIEDCAVVGGLSGIHQFCRIGKYALVGGCSAINKDIPPFIKAQGNGPKLYGLNTVRLKRHNFSPEVVQNLRRAYRLLFRSDLNMSQAVARIQEEIWECEEVQTLVQFVKTSERGVPRG
ncbi:MAG: acyl-ACP--UDP-N-acetylglucosamine O-acyltransferase [Candidatus Methylomirabilales bacterium]